LGLACAANVGSAATLIGNPENMLIAQTLRLSFGGYLVDNHAFQMTGLPERAMGAFAGTGLELSSPWALFGASFVLSNLVSNVPAVMLLLPVASQPVDGLVLALSSNLAGNLLVVSSLAAVAARRQLTCSRRPAAAFPSGESGADTGAPT
jgi:Na+/H+ antiporter NhaD/arsenite permease-like protein